MKKSELKQIIKEEIEKIFDEDSTKSRMSVMQLITQLTPQIEQTIEKLKSTYPKHVFTLSSNDKWRPDDESLVGTYTLSVSGPQNDDLEIELNSID